MRKTIASLLSIGTHSLRATCDSEREATRNAQLLLAHCCGFVSLSDLYTQRDTIIDTKTRHQYFSALKRRKKREPVQYITREVEFMDCVLTVDHRCLIPRPETEELVEHIIEQGRKKNRPLRMLDIGTGSGNIAIALAKALPTCSVDAIDIDEDTLQLAARNAERNAVAHKISFFISDVFDDVQDEKRYDIIVSNPPYIRTDEFDTLEPELSWEPFCALVSGDTGLEILERITRSAKQYLTAEGLLYCEIGESQGEEMIQLMKACGYAQASCRQDLSGRNRYVVAEQE